MRELPVSPSRIAHQVPRVLGLLEWTSPEPRRREELRDPAFPLPYRADLLAAPGELGLDVLPRACSRGHRKLRDVIEHRSGVAVDRAVRAVPRLGEADAVLAFLDRELTAPSWARRHHLPPYASRPLLGLVCWWAEELVAGQRPAAEVARVASGLDRLFVLSRNQCEILTAAGVDPAILRPLSFGVDERYYRPAAEPVPERFEVLAAGVDRGRDWASLVAAARLLPQVRFDVVTRPETILRHDPPENLWVHPPVPMAQHRENLRAARLVVVPTHDLAYPTGQSVLLEAMACGAPVAVTATAAMADYLDPGRSTLSLPPGDPTGIAAVIEQALADPEGLARIGAQARRTVEESFRFSQMWEQVRGEVLGLLR